MGVDRDERTARRPRPREDLTEGALRRLFADCCACRPVDLARSDGDHAARAGCDLVTCALVREVVRRRAQARQTEVLRRNLETFQAWGESAGQVTRSVARELRRISHDDGASPGSVATPREDSQ